MNKTEFLGELEKAISGLPLSDIEDRISFYSEMIDDYMEEGLTEDEAISRIGSAGDLAAQILSETPLPKIVKERITPKRKLGAFEIILLILGSPIWLSIMIALGAVLLSVYVVLWSVIAALWAIFVSFAASGIAGVAALIIFACRGELLFGMAMLGCGMAMTGLAIIMFGLAKAATKGIILLTKKITLWVKRCFAGKEKAHE